MTSPLRGIRVVELASWVFVPTAATTLAVWGADVIKIENPDTGDPMRGMTARDSRGAARNDSMDRMNHSKRSIGIDVKNPRGREVLLDLCRTADVFMTSWLPGARRRAGVDVDDIRGVNPTIVYARGSGYGPKGPEADRGSIEVDGYWARSGMAHYYTQPPERYGLIIAPSIGDLSSGQSLAGGIAAALVQRERTGEGSVVDVSLYGEGLYAMSTEISRRKMLGEPPEAITRENTTNPVINQYRTADGRVIQLGFTNPARWRDVVEAMGRPDLASDPRFADLAALHENRVAAIAELDAVFATRTSEEWAKAFEVFDRGWSIVKKAIEVYDDPQVHANDYITSIERPGSSTPVVRSPVQFDESPPALKPAPAAGEHTDEILAELGFDWDAIVDLKVTGAVL